MEGEKKLQAGRLNFKINSLPSKNKYSHTTFKLMHLYTQQTAAVIAI